jgi:hypothetical protein
MRATYVGPIEHLRGKTADVFIKHGMWHAQFDERNLTLLAVHPAPAKFDGPWPEDSLGFGRHAFAYFDLDVINPSA